MVKYLCILLFLLNGIGVANAQAYFREDIAIDLQANQEAIVRNRLAIEEYVEARTAASNQARARWIDAKLRKTKFYAAIYLKSTDLNGLYWAAGYKDQTVAMASAATACGDNCKLIATFSNTCVMLAEPSDNTDIAKVVAAQDPEPGRAIEKAGKACKGTYGGDCVSYARPQEATHSAYCVGYDYGIFEGAH
ncbi:DUF4189 domain-containing protein [Brachymonas sp. G13]|uniref:DUF4189 domain-containing protein n=1 Tax=Brachymonas wangyanguii TaxID=3130163 RepID=UPI00307E0D78